MTEREEAEQRLAEELGLSPNTIRVIKDERFDGFDTVVMRKLWNKLLAREMEREIADARDWLRSSVYRPHPHLVVEGKELAELLAEYAASKKKAGLLRAAEMIKHEVVIGGGPCFCGACRSYKLILAEAAKIEGE